MLTKVIEEFANNGIELVYHKDGNKGRGYWLYDGGVTGPVIELWIGVNGLGLDGIFGTYDAGNFGGQYSITSCAKDWLENYGKDIPLMAKGEELNW